MEITAFIMGVCHPQRLSWLKRNINHLDAQQFPFVRKIVAVDQFMGYTLPKELYDEFISEGWEVIIDNHHSRAKTMDHLLSIDTEYIFYNEDDVMSDLPKLEHLSEVFNKELDGRKCGMISLTVGGSDWIPEDNDYGDIEFLSYNILLSTKEYIIFRRLEAYKNAFFFEFPGLFIRSSLFKECHLKAKGSELPIEMALSSAYFLFNLDNEFYKCSVVRPDFLDVLLTSVPEAMATSRMLYNLDVNQGAGLIGGVSFPAAHNY